jgi:hypothetical protein
MPLHDWSHVPPERFHDFRQSWSIRIKDALNARRLPKGVIALVEQRAVRMQPDVLTLEARRKLVIEAPGRTATAARPLTRLVRRA